MFIFIKNIIFFCSCSFVIANINFNNQQLAKIGEKEITVGDFMQRSEYTPRPMYCKGSSNLEKRIILNTLIAEKLFAIENRGQDLPNNIDNYLEGRKEQKMRELLRRKIIDSSDINKNDLMHWYDLSNIEYDFVYTSLMDHKNIDKINRLIDSSLSFSLKNQINNLNIEISNKENITIFNIDSDLIREKLFSKKLKIGDIVGPIYYDSDLTLFLQIQDVRTKNDLNPITQQEKLNQVSELIDSYLHNTVYRNYVKEIMSGITFHLSADAYYHFINIIKNNISSGIDKTIYSKKLLALNNQEFNISEVLDWIKLHPLVFRDGYYADLSYAEQLKLALIDLVKDLELNRRSYSLDLDKHPIVIKEVEMWEENYLALKYRDEIIDGEKYNNSVGVDDRLNEHFLFLSNKFSDSIFINTSLLSKIKISSIDMVTYKTNSAYNTLVPMFPVLTDYYQFSFGQQLTMESH